MTRSTNLMTTGANLDIFPGHYRALLPDVMRLERKPNEIFEIVKQARAIHFARQQQRVLNTAQPIRPVPKVPFEIRFSRQVNAGVVIATGLLFFIAFCFIESAWPVAAFFAAIGSLIILSWLQRCIDRSSKLTLTTEAIRCSRLRQKRVFQLKDISGINYNNSGILLSMVNQHKPVRLKVAFLNQSADDIYRILLAVLENSRSLTTRQRVAHQQGGPVYN